MCYKYPITGSANTFKHFKCIIKFIIPFTTVVLNGRMMTSLIVWIFPFTPFRSHLGTLRPFTVFLLEITVLRCTCFQVPPACCHSFSVIVTTKFSMTWMLICTCTLSPYLWSQMIKNNISSLYQGKSGTVRLAFMYPFMVLKCPHSPWDEIHPISNSSVEGLSTPYLYRIPQWGWRFGTQYPPVPSTLPLYHNFSLIGMAKYPYQGITVVIPRFWCQFVGIYWCPWLLSSLLCIDRGR